jgi:hypothetical protein
MEPRVLIPGVLLALGPTPVIARVPIGRGLHAVLSLQLFNVAIDRAGDGDRIDHW